jgi:ABC-type nitrate/sulfonate/bicarbonate transport system permease component
MFVALVCLALLGKLSDTALRAIERGALRWRDTLGTERAA